MSLAAGLDGKANGSYQFHGKENSYIEFPNNEGTLDLKYSFTMLCWVYVSKSNLISPSILFIYYNKTNSEEYFSMAMSGANLAVYYQRNPISPDIQSAEEKLTLNSWHYVGFSYNNENNSAILWINGTIVGKTKFTGWTLGAGYRTVRMGYVNLKHWVKPRPFEKRITAMQVYNVSLTKQQIEAVKYVACRGKNKSCKI